MLAAHLIEFGLKPRQVKVYLALLKLKEAPTSVVARYCNLPRLTVYSILERLRSMRLIEVYKRRGVRVYRMISPKSLLGYCDDQISIIENKRSRINEAIPFLCAQFEDKESTDPQEGAVEFIRDRALFRTRCLQQLKNVIEWYVIHDGLLWDMIGSLRAEASLAPRVLAPYSEQRRIPEGISAKEDVRFYFDAQLKGPCNVVLVGDKLFFIFQEGEPFSAIEMVHSQMTDQMRHLFWLLWGMASQADEEEELR